MTYFMFVLLRPRRNDKEQFQRKEGRFVDFHTILQKKPFEKAWSVDPTRRLVCMHVSLGAEIAEKIAKQQQLTYTMGLKLYRSCIKRKLNHRSPSLGSMNTWTKKGC